MKKKKRKENKAKLNEEKLIVEEKSAVVEEEEEEAKCTVNTNGAEYADSCDGSEKSSSELVVSPRKIDEQEESSSEIQSDTSPKLSPGTNSSEETQSNEMVECSDSESNVSLPNKDSDTKCNDRPVFADLSPKCNHNQGNDNNKIPVGLCKTVPSHKCKNGYNNCCSKDSHSSESNGSQNGKGCHENVSKSDTCYSKHHGGEDAKGCYEHVSKSDACYSKHHGGEDGNHHQSSKYDPCKCDKETSKPVYPKTRNGFVTHQSDYRNNHYKLHNGHKKNGYIDCRNCSTVGPRFSRYEDQSRWKSNPNDYVGDVYDKFHNMNGNMNGRGRGKRKGGKYKVSILLV